MANGGEMGPVVKEKKKPSSSMEEIKKLSSRMEEFIKNVDEYSRKGKIPGDVADFLTERLNTNIARLKKGSPPIIDDVKFIESEEGLQIQIIFTKGTAQTQNTLAREELESRNINRSNQDLPLIEYRKEGTNILVLSKMPELIKIKSEEEIKPQTLEAPTGVQTSTAAAVQAATATIEEMEDTLKKIEQLPTEKEGKKVKYYDVLKSKIKDYYNDLKEAKEILNLSALREEERNMKELAINKTMEANKKLIEFSQKLIKIKEGFEHDLEEAQKQSKQKDEQITELRNMITKLGERISEVEKIVKKKPSKTQSKKETKAKEKEILLSIDKTEESKFINLLNESTSVKNMLSYLKDPSSPKYSESVELDENYKSDLNLQKFLINKLNKLDIPYIYNYKYTSDKSEKTIKIQFIHKQKSKEDKTIKDIIEISGEKI